MVEIMCDMDEAKLLLETARQLYPEAVPFIEDALIVASEIDAPARTRLEVSYALTDQNAKVQP